MATVNPASIQPKTTSTAEDTLQRKSRDASVISGGHLVAKALKNEGVDTIFTLCGGHIIDIYDGCVDEGIRIIDVRHEQVAAHAADGYARQTGKLGCVVTTAGPGLHERVDRHRHRISLRKPRPAHRRAGRAHAAQDGIAARFAARRHHHAHHQVCRDRAEHRARRGHGLDGDPRGVQRRSGSRVPGDSARRARPRSRSRQGGHSAAGQVSRIDALDRRPARHREIGRHPGECGAAGDPVRTAGVDRARPQRGDCAAARPRYPGLFQRRQPRPAAAGRSASLRPHAHPSIRERGCAGHRRYSVRLSHGLRQAHQQGPQAGADRHGLSDRRQESRRQLGAGRRSGRDLGRRAAGGFGPDQERQAAGAPAMAEATERRRSGGHREAHAAVQVEQHADSSVPRRLGIE